VLSIAKNPGSCCFLELSFDELIISPNKLNNFSAIPGLLEHALPIMTIGDATLNV